jgi:hypothetical protein
MRRRHASRSNLVGIEAPRAHGHCIEAWLLNLVDVLAVEVAPAL